MVIAVEIFDNNFLNIKRQCKINALLHYVTLRKFTKHGV